MFGRGKKQSKDISGVPATTDEDFEMDLVPMDDAGGDFDEESEAKPASSRDPIKAYTIATSIIVVLLGGWILYTARLVNRYETEIEVAKRDYSEIYELGKSLEENLERMGPDRSKGLEVPIDFFYVKANDSGIPRQAIKKDLPDDKLGKGFVEQTRTLTFKELLDRQQIANLLYNVEASHPVLKASEIKLASSGKIEDKSDRWAATLKFAYRVPRRRR